MMDDIHAGWYEERNELSKQVAELEKERDGYLRMLKMPGQQMGIRLFDAETKIVELEAKLANYQAAIKLLREIKTGTHTSCGTTWRSERTAWNAVNKLISEVSDEYSKNDYR